MYKGCSQKAQGVLSEVAIICIITVTNEKVDAKLKFTFDRVSEKILVFSLSNLQSKLLGFRISVSLLINDACYEMKNPVI